MVNYTAKQGQYLAFVHHYTELHGIPPAESDLQAYFKTTPPTVHQMIVKLEEKGLISRVPHTPRTIKVIIPPDQLPGLGKATNRQVSVSTGIWLPEKYTEAYRFAAKAHNGQLVTGTDLPYVMHISFVSMEVIACLGVEKHGNGDLAVQCALLHDVIEDTSMTYQDVKHEFGEDVANGVNALTKNRSMAKEFQMRDSLQRIRQQPVAVWLVKLADRITNLAPPPSHWDQAKIKHYREEALEIHQALQKASNYLSKRLELKIEAYKKYL